MSMCAALPAHERSLLKAIFVGRLKGARSDAAELSKVLGLPEELASGWLSSLESRGLVRGGAAGYVLTDAGRSAINVVLTGGVFDVIHPGHVYTLRAAAALGDVLVVVVARDSTVERNKGRPPLHGEDLRLMLVSALKPVDIAVLGSTGDIMDTVELVRPDVIALGYDQIHTEDSLISAGASRGLRFRVVRLDSPYPDIKTSAIRSKLGI